MILDRIKGERYSRVLPLWKGRTVAILAGGPSLTAKAFDLVREARDADALRSVAVNDSYLLAPWADLHYAADSKWHAWHVAGIPKPALGLTAEDVRARWAVFGGEKCSIEPAKDYPVPAESALEADERVHLLRNVHHPYRGAGLSLDPGFLVTGWNSGFQALNLSILAGASRVLLLGFDACHTADGRSHATAVPQIGWGAGPWSTNTWGVGGTSTEPMRLWSQSNFGENLIFGYRGGVIYQWAAASTVTSRGVAISTLAGASAVPLIQNYLLVSDSSRFVFAFGANAYGDTVQNPMLIRWSDQESVVNWTPSATNQAGEVLLSHGSEIITALQARQEVLVFTDSTMYSLQYVGTPVIWSVQLLGDNISIASQNAAALASGVTYWMGVDKFYKYDGRVQTLRCDLRQYIYNDINLSQSKQIFAGTNEGFNEVWFFYCSKNSVLIDKYVIYNYVEDVWSYGTMRRSAWLDSGIRDYPMAATYPDTGLNNIVYHENGVDDNATGTTAPIYAMIATSEFDVDDGDRFGFVWRLLPDVTFRGSSDELAARATMTLIPMQNSGSGANSPESIAGSSNAVITRTAVAPIEKFTGQVYVRVRGRQMILKLESNQIGTTWQMGSFRIDVKLDGRR